jgi:hypothetical protein
VADRSMDRRHTSSCILSARLGILGRKSSSLGSCPVACDCCTANPLPETETAPGRGAKKACWEKVPPTRRERRQQQPRILRHLPWPWIPIATSTAEKASWRARQLPSAPACSCARWPLRRRTGPNYRRLWAGKTMAKRVAYVGVDHKKSEPCSSVRTAAVKQGIYEHYTSRVLIKHPMP